MKPLKSLTLEAMIERLSETFKGIPDERAPARVSYRLHDTLMSGFALMFYQHPSLLQFQRAMKQKRGRSNLETIFGVAEVPSDTQMREVLDGVDAESVACYRSCSSRCGGRTWPASSRSPCRAGLARGDYYTIAIDGSDYFHSTKIDCPGCLRATDAKGGGALSAHGGGSDARGGPGRIECCRSRVEEVHNTDGTEKQDCEINAGKRLIQRFRREHRQMAAIISGDLYAHEPFVQELKQRRLRFVLVAKPDSHKELFAWVEMIEQAGQSEHGDWHEGPAYRRRRFDYRIVRQVPLTAQRQTWVTFIEVWERNKAGEAVYHNSFITDLEVDRDNVAVVVAIGRSKWKIENEQFNIHKNHGYELEHNYGHGERTLSLVFYLLNLVAFVAHVIVELGGSALSARQGAGVAARVVEWVADVDGPSGGPELGRPAAVVSG